MPVGKRVFITEKPSQAQDYIKALKIRGKREDGYIESSDTIITWCVGHLIAMSYPEKYDEKLKRWSLDTLPFVPEKYKYEVIKSVSKQWKIVKKILTRPDVTTIYFAGDSGREGQYIEELVIQECGAKIKNKCKKRIWIDSTTEDEILRGIREAKDMSEYHNMGLAGYCRAKEDYLMGINFSRLLTLKYGNLLAPLVNEELMVIAVGRVMTCVLGMVVRREQEILNFKETPFYRVSGILSADDAGQAEFTWKAVEGSEYFQSPLLYRDDGFRERADAEKLAASLPLRCRIEEAQNRQEKKNAPLLYNLAELQNECAKQLKIGPDGTLEIVQSLYEKKMVTYPRTDARVLSTAVAKEIRKNIMGLSAIGEISGFVAKASANAGRIIGTKYVDDKKITDHYAIIPTGQAAGNVYALPETEQAVYMMIVRRFLAVFLPPAVYGKISVTALAGKERLFLSARVLKDPGFLALYQNEGQARETALYQFLGTLRKGGTVEFNSYMVKEGKTQPPKRYNSGSIILAMENAGQLIEEEELREQIKGAGIGTSATRANIIAKLKKNGYISINSRTQVITPTDAGKAIYVAVAMSIPQMLKPELTANWEMGLAQVEKGIITQENYMGKLDNFIISKTVAVKNLENGKDVIRTVRNFL